MQCFFLECQVIVRVVTTMDLARPAAMMPCRSLPQINLFDLHVANKRLRNPVRTPKVGYPFLELPTIRTKCEGREAFALKTPHNSISNPTRLQRTRSFVCTTTRRWTILETEDLVLVITHVFNEEDKRVDNSIKQSLQCMCVCVCVWHCAPACVPLTLPGTSIRPGLHSQKIYYIVSCC